MQLIILEDPTCRAEADAVFFNYLSAAAQSKQISLRFWDVRTALIENEHLITQFREQTSFVYDAVKIRSSFVQRHYRQLMHALFDPSEASPVQLLNQPLGNKQLLLSIRDSIPHLKHFFVPSLIFDPENTHSKSIQLTWNTWLNEHRGMFIKPLSGSEGRGMTAIDQNRTPPRIWHRDKTGVIYDTKHLANAENQLLMDQYQEPVKLLSQFYPKQSVLIQPLLPLRDECERPFDMRILLWKSACGEWLAENSRCFLRIGHETSYVSNLHAGAIAVDASHHAHRDEATRCSIQIAERIEQFVGKQLELAFDWGIASNRRLYLLEVNNKPGKQAITHLYGEAFLQTYTNNLMEWVDLRRGQTMQMRGGKI